jgi:CDP-diglyceride synthetase
MEWKVFYITGIYLLLAAVGVFFIQRKYHKHDRWLKFFVYALVVFAVENAIVVAKPFPYLCTAIILAGINELIFAWRWHEGRKWHVLLIALVLFAGLSYAFFYFSMLPLSFEQLYLFLVVFTFDLFSKTFSELFSGPKLFSKISSHKTILGIIAGLGMAILTTYLLREFLDKEVSFNRMLFLSPVICFVALFGELLGSFYKKLHNVKTFTRLIPCNGGMLDVMDGFIFVGAAWWLAKHFLLF